MSDIIHLVPNQGQPGPGAPLPDPSDWVLGEQIHDSGILKAFAAPGGLVWVLSDLSHREAMVQRNTALAKLRHPRIQALAGIGLIGGHPYRADPEPDGLPLDSLLHQHGPFSVARTLDLALQLAEILVELHGRGLVHGHVHPGALRLDKDQLSLGDIPPLLGLNLPHVAPEVQLGAEADPRADLFGLGYAMLCMLRGSRPDGEGRDPSWRSGKPGPIAPLPPAVELDPEIQSLMLALLDRDPERRPRSALELAQALARARGPQRKPPSIKVVGLALGGVLLFGGLSLAYEKLATPPEPASVTPEQVLLPSPATVTSPAEPPSEPEAAPSQPPAPASALPQLGSPLPRAPDTPPKASAPAESGTEPADALPQAPASDPAPSAEPPSDAPAETEPPADAQAPSDAEAPSVVDVLPEPDQAPSLPSLAHYSGTYSGSANGRPFRLELQVDADGRTTGVAEQTLGAQKVRVPVRGNFAEDGRFTLVETEGKRPNTWSGRSSGDSLNGQLSSGGRSRGQWSASR